MEQGHVDLHLVDDSTLRMENTKLDSEVDHSIDATHINDGSLKLNGNHESDSKNDDFHAPANLDKGKKSFASLFKDNRIANESSLLHFVAPPVGELELGFNEIDSVEKTFGFCLAGYVMGNRPSTFSMINFVKKWGKDVNFTFKDNGWIKFQFPNEELRDSILLGGPYMIMGRQLFLKKLTSCFLFSKEEMASLPSWVQIHGLPADCWTNIALSRIVSVIGKPIHTDRLTNLRKGHNYARVLVELDATSPRIVDYSVKLPTGNIALIKFIYELRPKFCDKCHALGHNLDTCTNQGALFRNKNSALAQVDNQLGVNHIGDQIIAGTTSDHVVDQNDLVNTVVGDLKGKNVEKNEDVEDEQSVQDSDDSDFLNNYFEFDSVIEDDILSRVVPQDKDDWKVSGKKNKSVVNKKSLNKESQDIKKMEGGSSSTKTEYVQCDPRTNLPIRGGASKFLKEKLATARLSKR